MEAPVANRFGREVEIVLIAKPQVPGIGVSGQEFPQPLRDLLVAPAQPVRIHGIDGLALDINIKMQIFQPYMISE